MLNVKAINATRIINIFDELLNLVSQKLFTWRTHEQILPESKYNINIKRMLEFHAFDISNINAIQNEKY
jgi:hypothetical protein